jgi:hypothetical protein
VFELGCRHTVSTTITQPSGSLSIGARRRSVAVGYALVFLVIVAPTAYSRIKALLLLAALGGLGLRFLRTGRLSVHPAVLFRTLLFVTAGAFFVLVGAIRGNPGALSMAPVFVVWPVLYTVLIGGLDDQRRIDRLVQLLVAATFAIEFTMYDLLLYKAGLLPKALTASFDFGQAVSPDFTEFNSYNLASLLFLVPFLIGALVIWPSSAALPIRRMWLWLATLLAGPLVFFSGRRGLWVSVAIAPAVALIFRLWLRRGGLSGLVPWRRMAAATPVGLAGLVILQAGTSIDLSQPWQYFRQGFDFSTGDAGLGRALQFRSLIQGWTESPLIGKGLGAVAPDVIRSQEQPWSYELVYVALLFTTGILGVVLYSYGLAWIISRAGAMVQAGSRDAPVLLAVLVGTIGVIVASATNQYLVKFDGLWALFLPLVFINHWLLTRVPAPDRAPGATP